MCESHEGPTVVHNAMNLGQDALKITGHDGGKITTNSNLATL